MKRRRSHPIIIVSSLLILVLSACGVGAPTPTPTPAAPTYPPQRGGPSMLYDSKADTVLMFGGQPREYAFYDDAWTYKTSTNTWTPLSTSPTYAKWSASDYDSKADMLVFYLNAYFCGGQNACRMGETYVYDPNTDKLDKVTPKVIPFGFAGAQMVYDSESDRFVLFGGYDFKNNLELDETWAYDLNTNTWTAMNPAKHPAGRNFSQMTYIPTIDRVLLFSGYTLDSVLLNEPTGDTWLYDYNHDTWEQLKPSTAPTRRHFASMVYMSSIDRALLYGGKTKEVGGTVGDLWSFNPTTLDWEELHPATDPGKRTLHGMAYDSKADKVVLFGGGTDNIGPWTAETWLYDPRANTWTNVTPQE